MTDFLALLTALGAAAFRINWRIIRARIQAQGTDFSYPVGVIPALSAFVGTDNTGYVPSSEAIEDTFQGRSQSSGRRVDFSLYRAGDGVDDTFRYPMTGPVQVALTTASGNGTLIAIDGTAPSWYTYVNQNYNSYWEGELRS